MHELSLAHSLIEQILALAAEHGARKINRVVVTLGPFSGVVRDSFEFGFSVLKREREPVRDASLELKTPDPEYRCLDCGQITIIPFPRQIDRLALIRSDLTTRVCPGCGSTRLSPNGGTELILNQLEME
ncbi:MAG: hydrogenase maturation nickel metallochaperone HypA [Proteobacteria bacterium]|nr:hydrogenase maturation nickel metallochaperone HypA [Pseudomonadota bacterium]